MTRLGPDVLRDPERSTRLEWLLGDGQGGWAASSVVGLNTRRAHGLLVAPCGPAAAAHVLLARVEETLVVGGERFELGASAYPGTLHPRGFEHAVAFELTPLPALQWEAGGLRLTRTLARLCGEPTLALLYTLEGPRGARLELRPMLAYRAADALQAEHEGFRGAPWLEGGDLLCAPCESLPPLRLRVPGAEWDLQGYWYRRCEYAREREAGRAHHEDLWSPGVAALELRPGRPLGVLAAAGAIPARADAAAEVEREKQRQRALRAGAGEPLVALRRAADAFLVRRPDGRPDLVAGYPSSAAGWGPALVALPGVALETRRAGEARALVARLLSELQPAADEPAAVLLRALLVATRALPLVGDDARRPLFAWATALLEACASGRLLRARPLQSGLLADESGGCPVDLQALWFNALLAGAELARDLGELPRGAAWNAWAGRVRESVARLLWLPGPGFLADAWHPEHGADARLRARQVLAVALPHALLPRERAQPLLHALGRELLTPVGLRTLAPGEPAYLGRDDPAERAEDGRGGAWPELACAYFEALMRVAGEEGKRAARAWIQGFEERLAQGALGFSARAFDGDAPHAPRGPIAWAPAVGELLRLVVRVGPARPARP